MIEAALKAGLAEAVRTMSIDRLVADEARFKKAWTVTSSIPGSFGELNAAAMYVMFSEIRPTRVVEIGSYLGRSTSFFASLANTSGVTGTEVFAVDPHTGDRQQMEKIGATVLPSADVFQAHMSAIGATEVVRPIIKPSLEAAIGWDAPIDFLFIDGWHSFDAVMEDGNSWLPHLNRNGVVFVDDYSRYREVHDAVHTLASAGAFSFWGNAFGQAIGGHGRPSPAAQRVLKVANGRAARRLYRPR